MPVKRQSLLELIFTLSLVTSCNSNKIEIGLPEMHASLISEMKSQSCFSTEKADGKFYNLEQVNEGIKDFDANDQKSGEAAWSFLKRLSTSPTFISKFWQSNPLLLRSDHVSEITRHANVEDGEMHKNWIDGAFTVEKDLRLVDGSYISGSRTDDILRKGIKTDSWAFRPIKDNPSRPTTWDEVSDALEGGTIYFNSAGSFWPNLGALCRLSSFAFGLPSNVNIYITPPGSTISVPPHTDRQDVFVFQTEGSKRWRIYKPPKRSSGSDPLNRGKGGDVLAPDVLGKPILDVVLRRGDMMYIPGGFPHETDTTTVVENETVPVKDETKLFDQTSVHLTLGLDTHVWALTYAHVRWTLLQRCGMNWKVDIREDDAYWNSIKSLKVGFLADATETAEAISLEIENVKQALIQLEPERWDNEELPSDSDIREVIEYLVQDHLGSLLELQEEMYTNVNPADDNTIIKGYQCTQKQNAVMQKYGEFSKNDGMSKAFEQRSKQNDSKLSSASQ